MPKARGKAARTGTKQPAKNVAAKGVAKKQPAKKDLPVFKNMGNTARVFGIGGALRPKKDMTRFVKWPKYVRIQRQRAILLKRLKVPPMINQFTRAIDKNGAWALLNFLNHYRPETKHQKRTRLIARAAQGDEAKPAEVPFFVKSGIKHVTSLIESKDAKLVVIAHDVDPLELVLWMPTLCRKMGVPYIILKSKSRLGQVVNKKTVTCVAVTGCEPKHQNDLNLLIERAMTNFNNVYPETMKIYGGQEMGYKHRTKVAKAANK